MQPDLLAMAANTLQPAPWFTTRFPVSAQTAAHYPHFAFLCQLQSIGFQRQIFCKVYNIGHPCFYIPPCLSLCVCKVRASTQTPLLLDVTVFCGGTGLLATVSHQAGSTEECVCRNPAGQM